MQNHPKWLDKNEYPFKSKYLHVGDAQMHYIDEGSGHAILFVHGTPSWSFDFRKVIKSLSRHFRCIAMDHIGFGLSEKPKHHDYSIEQHCRTFEYFIEKLNLNDFTLVVHDFGGPIGFQYAIRHPSRIRSIVVLNSWLWKFSDDPLFKPLQKLANSPLLPLLYKYFNFSARVLLPRSFGREKPDSKTLKHYTAPFSKPAERLGCLAFAKSLVDEQEWFDTLWKQRTTLQHKPFLFVWGMADKFTPPEFLQRFSDGFHHCEVIPLPYCGHFPQEEQPGKVSEAMHQFINRFKTS